MSSPGTETSLTTCLSTSSMENAGLEAGVSCGHSRSGLIAVGVEPAPTRSPASPQPDAAASSRATAATVATARAVRGARRAGGTVLLGSDRWAYVGPVQIIRVQVLLAFGHLRAALLGQLLQQPGRRETGPEVLDEQLVVQC